MTNSIKIKILGYEFPEIVNDPYGYDSNWLNVSVTVQAGDLNWSSTHPCLLTSDLNQICQWFRKIIKGKKTKKTLSFIEPCLEIRWLEKQCFEFKFAHELSPQKKKDVVVPVEWSVAELEKFVSHLEAELGKYPVRQKC